MVFQVIMALVRRVELLDWFDRKLRGKNRYRCLRRALLVSIPTPVPSPIVWPTGLLALTSIPSASRLS